jgi:hypothetical protein
MYLSPCIEVFWQKWRPMLSIFLANFLQIDAMFDPLDNWVGALSTARSGERLSGRFTTRRWFDDTREIGTKGKKVYVES